VYLQRYLDGNPTGSYGPSARSEIAEARRELGTSAATPSPAATPSAPIPSPQLTVPTG